VKSLDQDYMYILHQCLTQARRASFEDGTDWVREEIAHAHVIPSLIGEENLYRHYDDLSVIRLHYLSWLREHRPDDAGPTEAILGPVWKRIADELLRAGKEAGLR
jgi:hypothetical protein